MNWVPKCCISARKQAAQEQAADHLPPVSNAHTLVNGTAVCMGHIHPGPAPVQPGAISRANGLILPGR